MARQTDRYSAGGAETEFEPGSRGRVLRNLLGIRSAREMAAQESSALLAAAKRLAKETRDDQRFSAQDIRGMHRSWLGEIYPWAGEDRQGRYFAAIQAALGRDYAPVTSLFRDVIVQTVRGGARVFPA